MDVDSSAEPVQLDLKPTALYPRLSFVARRGALFSSAFRPHFIGLPSRFRSISSVFPCPPQVPIINGKYTTPCEICRFPVTTAFPAKAGIGDQNAALKRHKLKLLKHGAGICVPPADGGGGEQGSGQAAEEEVDNADTDEPVAQGIQEELADQQQHRLGTVRTGGGAIGLAGGRVQRSSRRASAAIATPGAATSSSADAQILHALGEAEPEEEPDGDGGFHDDGLGDWDDEREDEDEVEAEEQVAEGATEAEEEVPEAEADAPAREQRHSSRLHRRTVNTLQPPAPAKKPTGGVGGAAKKSSVRGAAMAPPTSRLGFLRSQSLPNRSGPFR